MVKNSITMKNAEEWAQEYATRGYAVFAKKTTDSEWGTRPMRQREGILDAIKVNNTKLHSQGLWYFVVNPLKSDLKKVQNKNSVKIVKSPFSVFNVVNAATTKSVRNALKALETPNSDNLKLEFEDDKIVFTNFKIAEHYTIPYHLEAIIQPFTMIVDFKEFSATIKKLIGRVVEFKKSEDTLWIKDYVLLHDLYKYVMNKPESKTMPKEASIEGISVESETPQFIEEINELLPHIQLVLHKSFSDWYKLGAVPKDSNLELPAETIIDEGDLDKIFDTLTVMHRTLVLDKYVELREKQV